MPIEEGPLLALFERHGVPRRYRKQDIIFREEDDSREVCLVREGLVKICRSAVEGQSITLFLRGAGELFGVAEVLADQKRQREARCIRDSELLVLPAGEFVRLLQARPEALYAVAASSARRMLATQRYAEMLVARPVAWRLAHYLLQLGKREGDRLHLSLALSHEEISYIIGCSRQTVTETLNRWREQGLIAYEKKRAVIYDPDTFLTKL